MGNTPPSSDTSHHLPPEALETWLTAATKELGLDPAEVSISTILDVARDVAHNVARPAAPLSTYLLGLAVGSAAAHSDTSERAEQHGSLEQHGSPAVDTLETKAADLTRLALGWGSVSE